MLALLARFPYKFWVKLARFWLVQLELKLVSARLAILKSLKSLSIDFITTLDDVVTSDSAGLARPGLCWAPSSDRLGRVTGPGAGAGVCLVSAAGTRHTA